MVRVPSEPAHLRTNRRKRPVASTNVTEKGSNSLTPSSPSGKLAMCDLRHVAASAEKLRICCDPHLPPIGSLPIPACPLHCGLECLTCHPRAVDRHIRCDSAEPMFAMTAMHGITPFCMQRAFTSDSRAHPQWPTRKAGSYITELCTLPWTRT